MRVQIITLHNVFNCGSILQAHALQETVRQMGLENEIIDYIPERLQFSKRFFGQTYYQRKFHIGGFVFDIIGLPKRILMTFKYNSAVKKYLIVSKKKYRSFEELCMANLQAEAFICGSDQIWNSNYNGGIDKVYYLEFADKMAKRISYAASFGKYNIKEPELTQMKKLLLKFDYLSVREKNGLDILNKMEIQNGVNVLDPTLLLGLEYWNKYIFKKVPVSSPFLLVYALGKDEDRLIEAANKIAEALHIKIIQFGLGSSRLKPVHRARSANKFKQIVSFTNESPSDLLYLLANAQFVVSNSFHGTAFSINFNKPFISVTPFDYSERIKSVLEITGLQDRMVCENLDLEKVLEPIRYDKVNQILKEQKDISLGFLKNALGV